MDDNYNKAWRLDGRSHPAVTLPNDVALHYSLSVRGPVATVRNIFILFICIAFISLLNV